VEEGTPQGGSVSPLLANVYLHYVFDLWVQVWRQKRAQGDVIVVRFADDIVLGFQVKSDAERFRAELTERFRKFHLELHPEKTWLLEFGPYAAERRRRRGLGKPETFNFLGFTHICGKKRSNGRFTVVRQTIRKRLQAKLQEVKTELRRRMHRPLREQGTWLRSVVAGHVRYYGVPMNGPALRLFRRRVGWLWLRTLRRRGQRHRSDLGTDAAACRSLAASCARLSPLSSSPTWRHHLRWEPDAGNPHVRICGGGAQ
jgi:hypothetical protein